MRDVLTASGMLKSPSLLRWIEDARQMCEEVRGMLSVSVAGSLAQARGLWARRLRTTLRRAHEQ